MMDFGLLVGFQDAAVSIKNISEISGLSNQVIVKKIAKHITQFIFVSSGKLQAKMCF